MQSIKLPIEVCLKLDKLNKDFLWGHTNEGKKIHLEGLKWRVSDDCHIDFWLDEWVPDIGKLLSYAACLLSDIQKAEKVSDYVAHDDWDIQKLSMVLLWHIIHRIVSIHAGRVQSGSDRAIWGLSKNGEFSVKSAYVSLFKNDEIPNWKWNFLWNLRMPHRVQNFLWILFMENFLLLNIEL
ncbi:hypothetical protein Ddye_000841 [Dipteronia dyeriana]|uniref:Reverse transcriptase zinc-binding domain-containing protein n=1 Tax=Dipteronia dyeriana TaxID=168575 RepID=A0AAD9XN70_9ROSI|nr:hypothetical protein Ddye_000841 [Dipteronia dyeriana]